MRDLRTTVTGNVTKDVTEHRADDGTTTAVIRLASTARYFDQGRGEFSDRKTEFFTVFARRALARHVIDSVGKGDPLVVTGRLGSSEWTDRDGRSCFSLTIQAEAIGHDLTFGDARFLRSSRRDGEPLVDERTGEIAETVRAGDDADGTAGDGAPASAGEREPAMAGEAPF